MWKRNATYGEDCFTVLDFSLVAFGADCRYLPFLQVYKLTFKFLQYIWAAAQCRPRPIEDKDYTINKDYSIGLKFMYVSPRCAPASSSPCQLEGTKQEPVSSLFSKHITETIMYFE